MLSSMLVIIKGKNAFAAVKNSGYALRYVKEQTPEICIEAVKNYGYALSYVDIRIFEIDVKLK